MMMIFPFFFISLRKENHSQATEHKKLLSASAVSVCLQKHKHTRRPEDNVWKFWSNKIWRDRATVDMHLASLTQHVQLVLELIKSHLSSSVQHRYGSDPLGFSEKHYCDGITHTHSRQNDYYFVDARFSNDSTFIHYVLSHQLCVRFLRPDTMYRMRLPFAIHWTNRMRGMSLSESECECILR